jgi:uncharacterized protein (TIGR02001 family)
VLRFCCRKAAPLWVAALCLLVVVRPVVAADADRWSATVGVVSDYVLRGVDQSYEGAALQAGVSYQHPSGWFGGAWVSNVDPFPYYGEAAEVDLYGGYGWTLTRDFTARLSYTRYLYAFDKRPRPYDYGELSATLGYRDVLAATVSYDPDTVRYATQGYVRHQPSVSYELAARWPLRHGFAVTASAGYYDLTRLYGAGYWSGAAGLTWTRGRLSVDLNRFFADAALYRLYDEATADGRWVAGAAWRF